MPALQIWTCHVTQEANLEKNLFFPNSAFNIRKRYKISSRKALYFRSYQPKTSQGGGVGKHSPVLLELRPVLFVVQVMSDISKQDCIHNKRIPQCNKMRFCFIINNTNDE